MNQERLNLWAALAATALLVSLPRGAKAQGEVALAETLYRTARDLMAEGKYAEACPKFAESYRLDRATGTLLNLAACHEAEGKLASAWIEYMDAASAAKRDGREDRVKYAEDHKLELEPKLSRLTITLAPGVDAATLQITVDGALVGAAVLGVPAPRDPGPHVVEAKASGRLPFAQTVTLGAVADHQTVTIPALEVDPASAVQAAPTAVAPVAPPQAASSTQSGQAPVGAEASTPTSVYVVGGVTLALAAGATVTGILYFDRKNEYEPGTNDQADYDAAQTMGYVNAGLWVGTVVGAAVTGYLYFSDPKPSTVAAPSVVPLVGRGFAGVAATGAF